MPRIGSAFVEVRPETVGFRNEARRAIAEALAAVNASVPLTAESRGLRQEVRRAASAAAAGVNVDVPVSAESRGLRGEVNRAAAAAGVGQNVKIGVKVDDAGGGISIGRVLAELGGAAAGAGGALKAIIFPAAVVPAVSAATAGLVAMAGAAVAVVAPLGQLASLIPALAVGGIAIAAGFGVVKGALSGVGDALKAYSAEQKEAATAAVSSGRSAQAAAKAQEAAAEAVESATDRLAQARENQVRDAERNAESIADASRSVADAQEAQVESAERSAEQIAAAQDRLLESHDRVVDAERDVADLRSDLAERAAEAQERYAERVEQSNEDILQAEEDLADRRIKLAEDVADAQRRLDEDRLEGQDRIRAAEDRIRDVQKRSAARDRERRQQDQDRQRLDAARTPEERRRIQGQIDARKSREQAAADRDQAARDIKDAQNDLAKARKDAVETERRDREALADAQKAQAEGVEDAEHRVTQARKEGLAVQKEGQRLARQQVEDERRIAEAVGGVEEARKAEAEAQRDVGRAQLQASQDAIKAERSVADAVDDLAKTRRNAERSATDAQKSVLDAERDLQRAMRHTAEVAEEAGTSGAASVDKFAEAMKGLSPAAQSFVRALIGAKETLRGLRDTAAESLFPGFEAGLRNVMPLLDSLHPIIDRIARVIGTFTDKLGALLAGPESLKAFAALGESSAVILERLGDAALILLPPIGQLLVAAIPLAEVLADMATDGARAFAAFIDGQNASGGLAEFFKGTESTLRTIGSLIGNVTGALGGIFSAAMPTGREYLRLLDAGAENLKNLINSDPGQSGLRKFFEDSKPLVLELGGLFRDLVGGLIGIGAKLAPELTPIIAQIRSELVPALLELVGTIDVDFLSLLVSLAASVARFAKAFLLATPVLKGFLGFITDLIDGATSLFTKFGPLSDVLVNVSAALTIAGAAFAGFAIVSTISKLVGSAAGLQGVIGLLGGISLPVVLAGAAIAGAAVLIVKNLDTIKSAIRRVVEGFQSSELASSGDVFVRIGQVVGSFVGYVREQFSNLAGWVRENWASIQEAIGHVVNVLQAIIGDFAAAVGVVWRTWGDELIEIARIVWDQIRNVVETVVGVIRAVIETGLALINGDWGKAWDGIKEILSVIWEFMRETVVNGLRLIGQVIEGAASVLRTAWNFAWSGLEDIVANVWGRIEDIVRGGVRMLGNVIAGFLGGVAGVADAIGIDSIAEALRGAADAAGGWGERATSSAPVGGFNRPGLAAGGTVPGVGDGDTMPIMATPGEYMIRKPSVRSLGPTVLDYMNRTGQLPRFADGGLIDTVQGWISAGVGKARELGAGALGAIWPRLPVPATMLGIPPAGVNALREGVIAAIAGAVDSKAQAPPATGDGGGIGGLGSVGTTYQSILAALDGVGMDYTVTSAYRPGDPGFHGRGKAVDLVGDMPAIFHTIAGFDGVNELFFDPIGWFLDEGRRYDGAIGDHDDHVHAATFDRGGVLEPGWNRVNNTTGGREPLVPAGGGIDYDRLARAIESRPITVETTVELDGKTVGMSVAKHVAAENQSATRGRRLR